MVRAGKHGAAGDVGLRGRDVFAERDGAGERLRAGIAGVEHAALDFDACRDPRRVRTNLDYDRTVVSQPEPYDCGEVSGSEDLIRWRAAEMLDAPLSKARRIDGMRAR
ncbi:MAG: hypothetical protein ACRDQ7_03025 [Haloechinothrix sp.]